MTAPAPVGTSREAPSPTPPADADVAVDAGFDAPLDSPADNGLGEPGRRATEEPVLVYRPPKNTQFRTRPSLDFSLIGLVYCAMMMFMGLAAINSQANLLFGVFGLMIGVLLISGIISRWVLRHVEVRRIVPESAAVGEPLRIFYEIDNRKRWWPTLSLTIVELDAAGAFDRQPHSYVLHAAAGASAKVASEVVPMRRGLHRLERYQLVTSFPFGFIKRALIRRDEDNILVYPAQGAVEPTALLRFFSAQSTGINQRPREGGYDEFFGAREYRRGDPPRMIHWRRSARTSATQTPTHPGGTLVVKQMTRVSPPRVMLLVDTYVPPMPPQDQGSGGKDDASHEAMRQMRQQQLADVERNLAVAASLLAAATRKGLSVGLVAWNGQQWLEMRPDKGKRHRRDLLAALAELPQNETMTVEKLLTRGLPAAKGDTTAALITSGRSLDGSGDYHPDPAPSFRHRLEARHPHPRGGPRGNLVVIPTTPPELDRWVRFPPTLNFEATVQQ